jgi:2-haloacid dehalogenase
MAMTRRDFGKLIAASAVGAMALAAERPRDERTIKAIAFDAFPIFDPRPVFTLAESIAPHLSEEWRTRQFEYTWLRALTGKYADFEHVTRDALVFAAKKVKVQLSADQREKLVKGYFELKPWPDVAGALQSMKKLNYRLVFLSNFTRPMLEGCIHASGLNDTFDEVISTDEAKTYKPDPRAYQLACDRLKLKKEEILFVAFAGWDAAGATSFGLPTFWVNRLDQPPEELGVTTDLVGKSLKDLLAYMVVKS